jgi:CrcB protein
MGAFTTFSTMAYETGELLRDSEWLLAMANLVGQNCVGLACVYLGFIAARWL